jgi:DNA-binding NarL/FixJ family response regulator
VHALHGATDALRLSDHISRPLPPPLRRWLADDRARSGAGGASSVSVDGLRLRARLVRDAYPELDAIHLAPVVSAIDATMLRGLGLTRRQAEVLELALQGETSPRIAARLTLSRRTIEKHFDGIYARLGVRNGSEAIVAATTALGG